MVMRFTARVAGVEEDDDGLTAGVAEHVLREGLRQVMEYGRLDARPQVVDLCGT